MAIPTYQEFMLPFLRTLGDGQEHKLREIYKLLASESNLTEEEMEQKLPSGKQLVFHNRIGWARTYLKKAGLIDAPQRGVFTITQRGRDLLKSNPQEVTIKTLEQFPDFLEFKELSSTSADRENDEQTKSSKLTPVEQIDSAFKSINSELIDELLDTITQCTPLFFEQLVVELLLKMGYGGYREDAGIPTQYTNDGGIDGIINEDPLGLDTIYLQAKRYSKDRSVGRPDVQSFAGALDMQKSRKGVFITTSRFSNDAIEYVNLIEKSIVLIDGKKLASLMIQYNLGVTIKQVYEIKDIDTDYFLEE
ncbi:restriction endonuclease [Kangiella aquimarina]|uniref:Restriction endonuclease n=1 Tax=Kangiella aquimarina TaxID=261965 RepID=A0ABZ0X2T7_9GAMM|nr:restriction endonuclease [Kangiella aquimarina]WQG84686.1 restriction endonuclease [Kangiella aquimarina]